MVCTPVCRLTLQSSRPLNVFKIAANRFGNYLLKINHEDGLHAIILMHYPSKSHAIKKSLQYAIIFKKLVYGN